jgi:hypothetical protein
MQRLGIVLFGANVFDNHKELNNPRFANSAKELRKILTDQSINRGRETEVLDLYNKPLLPNDAASKIIDFVGKDYDDFIVYYCGHGDVGRREGDYRVFLRPSNRIRRHNTLLHIAGLIHDVQGIPERKRVYFILDACYSGSAISDMETMDAGGAEKLIDRSLSEAIEGGNGTAILAASGKLAVAYAKQEDRLTLFTGALVRCLQDGIAHKSDFSTLSWLDIKDEIIRTTRDRLGPDAPIPKLTSFSDDAVDIARVPFFENRAYKPRTGGGDTWVSLDDRTSEHLYWRGITEKSPAYVLEDFLARFPKGTFAIPARALLTSQIDDLDEKKLEAYLYEHPRSLLKGRIIERLTALKWNRLQTGNVITELERFIEKFPQSEFVGEAQRRIEFLRAGPVVTEPTQENPAPEPVEPPSVPTPPSHLATPPIAVVEVASIADIPVPVDTTPANTTLAGATSVGSIVAGQIPDSPNWVQRFAKQRVLLIGLFLFGLLLAGLAFQNFLRSNSEAFQRELDAAGTDITKLAGFIDRCRSSSSCTLEQEARDRLTNVRAIELIQANYRELDAAGDDIAKLSSFIDRCKPPTCTLEPEARNRLANAKAVDSRTRLAAAARQQLDAAGTDTVALRSFVDRCKTPSCTLGSEASSRLAAAEAGTRLAALEAERTRAVAEAERTRLAAAEADRTRLAAAEIERTRLEAERARAAAAEAARVRLAALEAERTRAAAEAERNRLARIGFNAYVNYDIYGGDIEIIKPTDVAACMSKCQTNSSCVAYSFDKWNKSCYIKNTLGNLILDPHSDTNIRRDQPHPGFSSQGKSFCRYSNSTASGDDLPAFASPSIEMCEKSCGQNQSCVAFTFRRTDNQCQQFRSVRNRDPDPNTTLKTRTQYSCT